ncbi:MAG TPA: hypothetical protein VMV32_04235 [Ignavibacteriaceae bacterium]|nr:hypothetical protein [Ignavibacteriaceae bacterium]
MKDRPNEIDALEKTKLILSDLCKAELSLEMRPDIENRQTKDIDCILLDQNSRMQIAIEHTIVESFDNQIKYVEEQFRLVKAIESHLTHFLPDGKCFDLSISEELIIGKNKSSRKQLAKDIAKAISPIICTLAVDEYDEIRFQGKSIYLMCYESVGQLNCGLVPIQLSPENKKQKAKERFFRAYSSKVQKLISYKGKGLRTCLILEYVAGSGNHRILNELPTEIIDTLRQVDYIVQFISNDMKMIVGNVWKINDLMFTGIIPYEYRYSFLTSKVF